MADVLDTISSASTKANDIMLGAWLKLLTKGKAWELIHMGGMLALNATEQAINNGKWFQASHANAAALAKSSQALNQVYEYVRDPNISGVIIHAASEKSSRDVDVSEHLVMSVFSDNSDSVGPNKQYVVENSAPKLREWQVEGYLVSTTLLSAQCVVKTDLLTKMGMLDYFAKSRRPVLYKTSDCRFYKCLITHYECEYDPKATNAVHVSVSLKEYVTADVSANGLKTIGSLAAKVMQEVA